MVLNHHLVPFSQLFELLIVQSPTREHKVTVFLATPRIYHPQFFEVL